MENVNLLGSLVSAILVFFLGGLWYSKFLFGGSWKNESGVKMDATEKGGHPTYAMIMAFVLAFIAALLLSFFLGPKPELGAAVKTGLFIGLGWVATSMATNYLFCGRSLKIFLIDAGYHVVQFLIYGLILGIWH